MSKMKIPFIADKNISFDCIEKILNVSKVNNHYSNDGPVKLLLEKKLEKILEIKKDKKVICVSSGTSALHCLMFYSEKYKKVKNWVTPSFTFPSVVVNNVKNVEIKDINSKTYTLPLDSALLQKYDGIIITNLFGTYSDLYEWEKYCKENNKTLIFDNASSPLSKYNGVNICNFGNYVFGSLHHTKYLGFGEGGFIVAPKKEYNIINSIANFGFYRSREYKRFSSNFKMSDISASFILNHIKKYNINKHKKVQNSLIEKVNNIENIQPFNYRRGVVYNSFPVLFNSPTDIDIFKLRGIIVHKYYKPLISTPNSDNLYNHIINFPLNSNLNLKKINYIVESIRRVSEN